MNFELPDLDISFERVVIKKAVDFNKTYLSVGSLIHGYIGNIERIQRELSLLYYDLPNQTDKFIFIREILIHIAATKGKYNEDIQKNLPPNKAHAQRMLDGLNEANDTFDAFTHFLAGLLIKDGYNLDKNAFTYQENWEIQNKVDDIVSALEKIQAGQEILAEEFDAMKLQIEDEFKSLKSDTILGKKSFYHLALGKISSYAGNKIADGIFDAIKPQLLAFFTTQAPHLLDSLHKFLN